MLCRHAYEPYAFKLGIGALSGRTLSMIDGHSTDLELQNRATFRLPLQEGLVIDEHLRACPDCTARYQEIMKDKSWAPPVPTRVPTGTV